MNRFLFSFIKRFIIVPMLFTAVASAAVIVTVPSAVMASAPFATEGNQNVDVSLYNLVEYSGFDELEQGDYVAQMIVKDADICCAVCCNSAEDSKDAVLMEGSIEPWNGGSVIIEGFASSSPLKGIRKAREGSEIEVDFYKNKPYTYTVKSVDYSCTYKQVIKEAEKCDLIIAVPYNDFEGGENAKLYITYSADLGGVE